MLKSISITVEDSVLSLVANYQLLSGELYHLGIDDSIYKDDVKILWDKIVALPDPLEDREIKARSELHNFLAQSELSAEHKQAILQAITPKSEPEIEQVDSL